jgi:hypothetical protein
MTRTTDRDARHSLFRSTTTFTGVFEYALSVRTFVSHVIGEDSIAPSLWKTQSMTYFAADVRALSNHRGALLVAVLTGSCGRESRRGDLSWNVSK